MIAGQLNIEIQNRETDAQIGQQRIVAETRISVGGRAYRQALYGKGLGLSVILLGRTGDDSHGKLIRDTLAKDGISTRYIEEAAAEQTGLCIRIQGADARKQTFYDPGANLGYINCKTPIEFYLHLCDVAVVNKWCHFEVRKEILAAARSCAVPNIYVCSGMLTPEEQELPIDYLFLDYSENDRESIDSINLKDFSIGKGIFVFKNGAIHAVAVTGEEIHTMALPPEWNADQIVSKLMVSIKRGLNLSETMTLAGELVG